jgi:hypothetical protein
MAAGVSARLTAAQGRRFGLTVGAAFLVFAALAWWRDHPTPSAILGSLGAALCVAGLVVPTHLGPVERAWMALAHYISKVTTPIVMGAMYVLVLTPAGLLRRRFGRNPMVHAAHNDSYWQSRPEGKRAGNLTRQF